LTPAAALFATQNLTAVLRVLQWGVIVLIFVFFLRVIRAVWVEVSPAPVRKTRSERRQEKRAARPARAEPKRKQLFLRVLEPEAHQGETFDLDDELTIGRSLGCGVPTPDDIYASTVHARLYRQKDQLWVEDLGSTNGTYVNSERIGQAHRLGKGDVLQAGSTVFEVTR
jgi:pSer/pThr/pTyr-binding forkhead associated (FHA) protein